MPVATSSLRRRLVAAWLVLGGAGAAMAQTSGAGPQGGAPVPVQVAEATRADVPVRLEGLGTVQAYNTVTIHARVDGELQQVLFTEGQLVRRGEVIARIDPRPYQAALDAAVARKGQDEAQLVNARLNLARYADLAQRDFASRQQLDGQRAMVAQLEATVAADQAGIDSARTQLGYATIASPIDGVTGIRLVDAGNLVRATDAGGIVVITQVQPISLIFTVPAGNLPEIRREMGGHRLEVAAVDPQAPRPIAAGTLALVDNEIDQTTGTIRLKATFPNADNALWPGQFVTARLTLRVERGVVTVPSSAVQRGAAGYFMFTARPDGTAGVQPVGVRRWVDDVAVLEGDVAPGLRVVTAGQYRLTDGARIQVAQTGGAPAAATPARGG